MASNILGKIAVMLGLDSAAFEAGTSKATKLAQKSAKDITSAFEGAGGKIGSFFEHFGEAGGPLAGAFGGLGNSVSGVMSSLGPLAGALGPMGIAALGAAAGLAAVGVAVVGIAVHAAGTAAELYDLSLKTGVSVESLSRLGFVARQSGLSQEALANGLEKMNKSAFAAATATKTATTPYDRLGISVKDANGHIKDSETLLTELATKFSKMPEGPAKTAMAMQVFGKSGAGMLLMLDKGADGIKQLSAQADVLGVTLSGSTARSAKEFEEKLDLVGETMTGIGNIVLKDLLPVMTSFMDYVDHALMDQNSVWRQLGSYLMDILVPVIKIIATLIETVGTLVSNLMSVFVGLGKVIYDALSGNFKQAASDAANAGKQIADSWKNTYGTLHEMWAPKESKAEGSKGQSGDVDESAANKKSAIAAINELIAKLKAQADAEGQLATAVRQTRAETLYATAAQEAQKQVEQEEAVAKKDGLSLTKQQKAAFTDAAIALSVYKAVAADQTSINNTLIKTQEETTNLKELAAAYSSGSQMAEYLAQKHQALSAEEKKAADLQELLNIATQNGIGQTTAGAIVIARLNAALKEEQANLKALAEAYDANQQQKFSEELSKENNSIQQNIEALQGKIAATQLGAEALREYAVQQQTINFLQTHQGMNAISPEFIAYKQALEDQSKEEQRIADISSVDSQVKIEDIQDEITRLEALRQEYQQYGQDTTAIDAKIHTDTQQMIKDQANLLTQTQQWQNGVKAGLLNIQAGFQTTAQLISTSMQQAFTGILTQIVLMTEGAKTSWRSMLNQISTEIEKFLLSSIIKQFLTMFAQSNFAGGLGGGMLFGSGGIFGGGHAAGGDVSPGTTYLVGEQGPELFTSSTAGSIVPNSKLGGSSNTTNYVIDARGADAGAEQRIRMALRDVENRSVARSVATINDQRKRT